MTLKFSGVVQSKDTIKGIVIISGKEYKLNEKAKQYMDRWNERDIVDFSVDENSNEIVFIAKKETESFKENPELKNLKEDNGIHLTIENQRIGAIQTVFGDKGIGSIQEFEDKLLLIKRVQKYIEIGE